MSLDITQAKRRAVLTAAINLIAIAAALAAGYGYLRLHIDNMLFAFAAGVGWVVAWATYFLFGWSDLWANVAGVAVPP